MIIFEFNFSTYTKLKTKKIRTNLKKVFKEKIEIFNEAYINFAVICMPSVNHFTLFIENVDNKNLIFKKIKSIIMIALIMMV